MSTVHIWKVYFMSNFFTIISLQDIYSPSLLHLNQILSFRFFSSKNLLQFYDVYLCCHYAWFYAKLKTHTKKYYCQLNCEHNTTIQTQQQSQLKRVDTISCRQPEQEKIVVIKNLLNPTTLLYHASCYKFGTRLTCFCVAYIQVTQSHNISLLLTLLVDGHRFFSRHTVDSQV